MNAEHQCQHPGCTLSARAVVPGSGRRYFCRDHAKLRGDGR